MDSEGINIELGPYGRLYIHCKEQGTFELYDQEADPIYSTGWESGIHSIPPDMEYKILLREDDD